MRTTEVLSPPHLSIPSPDFSHYKGVWLSLCPTKDQLVVAMDFEGQRPALCRFAVFDSGLPFQVSIR